MKFRTKLYCILLILFLAMSASCTMKTNITDSWMDETFQGGPFKKVLVLGVSEKISYRNIYEGEFVRQLQEKGIDAVASYTLLPDNKKLSRENILAVIANYNIDAVIVTTLIDTKNKDIFYTVNSGNLYTYYSGMYSVATTTDFYSIPILYLETKLFDVSTEKKVWSITTETEFKYNIDSIFPAISSAIKDLLALDLLEESL